MIYVGGTESLARVAATNTLGSGFSVEPGWGANFWAGLRGDAGLCYTSCMPDFAAPVERLIDELKHLPGIGQKTAQRLAFFILRCPPEDALGLADAIRDAKEKIRECSVCSNITENDPCHFCTGANRDKKIICVVEEAHNIMAIEKTRTYSGMYHVLGGSLSPLSGRGPDQLRIKPLIERLKGGTVEEIIIATNPTAEGEATAVYLSKLLKPLGVRVTRIGVGIPVGADLEYADEVTMLKALEGRRDL
jgi:recombination protein RecR